MQAYDKALKKLAAQISRTIKPDTTYRNIPFGAAQIDVHSDGKIVLLAVKVLDSTKKFFNVREFQIPLSKLRKFLVGDEMRMLINNSDITIFFNEEKIVNQISQGIAQIVRDSKKKNEVWIFPFHNHFIAFKKEQGVQQHRGLVGRVASVKVESNNPVFPVFHPVSGVLFSNMKDFVKPYFAHETVEFRIYQALIRNSIMLPSGGRYSLIADSSMRIEAA